MTENEKKAYLKGVEHGLGLSSGLNTPQHNYYDLFSQIVLKSLNEDTVTDDLKKGFALFHLHLLTESNMQKSVPSYLYMFLQSCFNDKKTAL